MAAYRRHEPEATLLYKVVAGHLEELDLPLSDEEFERRISAPLLPEEIEETRDLLRWFTKRCPTPAERLAYVRRKVREWTRPVVWKTP